MDVTNTNPEFYVDLFGSGKVDNTTLKAEDTKPQEVNQVRFGSEMNEVDLIAQNVINSATTVTETTTQAPEGDSTVTDETTLTQDVDLLADTKGKPGRKPKYEFEDATGYFADRIKSGKFVNVEEEDAEGNKKPFLPKTPEEFDELIDIQINYKLEQEKKKLQDTWTKSKSPAWQAVAKYAELVDDPTEVLPFIQGIKNFDSVAALNENDLDEAERIVRIRLERSGDPEEVIEQQIEALKTTDKLVSTAKIVKPMILKDEQKNLQVMMAQREAQEKQYFQVVQDIEEKTRKVLDSPLMGKIKLKQEEKASIYELIGIPSEETEGYQVYSEIDKLYDQRDFATLAQIALLLKHKDSFYNYISSQAAADTSASLQKKLRVAGEKSVSKADSYEDDDEQRVVVNRGQFKAPKFGRS